MRYLCVLLFVALTPLPAIGQASLQREYDRVYDAWDAGRYPDALMGFQKILGAKGGDEFLDRIALVTGELYKTIEIAPHGNTLKWSPDGRFVAYSTKSSVGEGDRFIGDWKTQKTFPLGPHISSLVFSPSGDRVALLVTLDDDELKAAKAKMAQYRAARDFPEWRKQASVVQSITAANAVLQVVNLATKEKIGIDLPGLSKTDIDYTSDGTGIYLTTGPADDGNQIFLVENGSDPVVLTEGPGQRTNVTVVPGGRYLVYNTGENQFALHDLNTKQTGTYDGTDFTVSADGSTLAYLLRSDGQNAVNVLALTNALPPRTVQRTEFQVDNPALSPDGSQVVYQMRPREDWELYISNSGGGKATRLTYDIQHDLFPRFIDNDRVLGIIGEGRHRRSFVFDAATGKRTRLFHNNTIRTVAPEYEWAVSPDGQRIAIVSERDGDTISWERALYVVDMSRKLSRDHIGQRLSRMLAAENALRSRGEEMFKVIADDVRVATSEVSITRLYDYARHMHSFGTKYIGEPGNLSAIDYLKEKLNSFGYEVELQWFEPRPGIESANVIATLVGTVDPDLVYAISSHFDSSRRGPGADDNSSGSTVLLETARVLADRPQPATIKFAFFTGEEAGLLGSRYYVKKAVEEEVKLVGALNNDMVGWANNHKLDDTIRYSNQGIRDVQHAAAIQFSDLITFDAKYYKSTDAHAYYDAYGDIVGGIGSYPILSSPHYHQSHDVLEIINHRLVTEVAKTTTGTIMLLASSPSRLTGLKITKRSGSQAEFSWNPALESDVTSYIVSYGRQSSAYDKMDVKTLTVTDPKVFLTDIEPSTTVHVKAVNERGLSSWDWAKITVDDQ